MNNPTPLRSGDFSKTFWQTTFALTFAANLVILVWSVIRWAEIGVILYRSVWGAALLFYLGALAGCVFLFLWMRKADADRLVALLELNQPLGASWRFLAGAVFAGILLLIPWLKFTFRIGEVVKKSTQDPVLTTILFYWACWWLILLAAGALKVAFRTSWPGGFASALVLLGLAYELFLRFKAVTNYPFSMGWSEASRFYYGSLYFAQRIYGMSLPLSTLHPTRYFLQSLPFLFPDLGLTASRLWQVLLWIILTGATSLALAWRVFSLKKAFGWLFAGWFFLYLLRVGVYYHLEGMVFVPLLFVSARHPWRSLAAVVLASLWAGVSRVNWFPVPAMLAAAIYLLETPVHPSAMTGKAWVRYLRLPALWALAGLLSALAAQAAYIPLSGNAGNASAFLSSFTSDLLWYRLWPNDSYPLGIVAAMAIVGGPLLFVLGQAFWGNRAQLHWVRWLGLAVMLAVLLAGGLVVSVKIGGGGDLHNMDAFAVLLGVVAAYFIGGQVAGESESGRGVAAWPVAAVALLVPLAFLIPALSPLPKLDEKGNQAAFEQLKTLAEQSAQKGPVLFINERQLVTFHKINVPLVPDYEAVTLMEMVMSNNQPYLRQFYADLKNHRFAAIVAGKQNVGIKADGAFAEENNVWNTRVSPYLLCYYEPVTIANIPEAVTYIEADESRIEFYVPRAAPGLCP